MYVSIVIIRVSRFLVVVFFVIVIEPITYSYTFTFHFSVGQVSRGEIGRRTALRAQRNEDLHLQRRIR